MKPYLDRVTISTDEFYHRLVHGDIWPASTQPSPQDFANTYDKLCETTNEILVIILSSRLSGTYQSAMAGKNLMKAKKCRIEVIDSQTVAGGLGLVVLAAAREAQKGANLDKLVEFTHKALKRSHFIVYFDTLKYLAKGGRIGKAAGLLGSVLSIKPILNVKEGEMSPVTRVRSPAAGVSLFKQFHVKFQEYRDCESSNIPPQLRVRMNLPNSSVPPILKFPSFVRLSVRCWESTADPTRLLLLSWKQKENNL